jgi:hypothetical protein
LDLLKITPLNTAAHKTPQSLTRSTSGLVIGEGYAASRKRRFLPTFKRNRAGDVLPLSRKEKVVLFPASEPLAKSAVGLALQSPDTSAFPVFEVSPTSGKMLFRISQLVLTLSLVYLAGGVFVGVVLPTSLRYASIFYGGSDRLSSTKSAKIKKVISEFEVPKENKIDDRTKEFFAAIKAARAGEAK